MRCCRARIEGSHTFRQLQRVEFPREPQVKTTREGVWKKCRWRRVYGF